MQDLHFLSYLASWTMATEYVAGATQKMPIYKEGAPKQTLLHCSYAKYHHGVGQSL